MNRVGTGVPAGFQALALIIACLAGCVSVTQNRLGEPAPTARRVQAQLDLARGYLANSDYARVRGPLLRALELDPGAVEAHVLAGVLYERENETETAERHYRKALEIEPANAQALNNYGAFLYEQGRHEDALAPLRLAVQDAGYRQRAQAFENLGLAELRSGRVEAARQAFERALSLGPGQPRSRLELAEIAFAQRDYAAAEHHYRNYLNQTGETMRSLCLGLRLGGVPGATRQSNTHAAQLQSRYPEATEACP